MSNLIIVSSAIVIVIIILALLAFIAYLLAQLSKAGSHSGAIPLTPATQAAVNDSLYLINTIRTENRPPTDAECKRLKAYLQTMEDGNISSLNLRPIQIAINELCP